MRYCIDPAESELRILVYRAGPMASLGHNHVIVNRALEGFATFDGSAARAQFALRMPVAAFSVDEAPLRRAEGADFADEVTNDAKSGTLHNMLGAAVLDAANHPQIAVQSTAIAGEHGVFEATVAISVAGHESTLAVPFTLKAAAGRLTASGAFSVRQSDLGLTPFSVFLGALRVRDELRIEFSFVALAAASGIEDSKAPPTAQSCASDSSTICVPSGACSTAAGRRRSGAGIGPDGSMPTAASRARVPPTSSAANTRAGESRCAGS